MKHQITWSQARTRREQIKGDALAAVFLFLIIGMLMYLPAVLS